MRAIAFILGTALLIAVMLLVGLLPGWIIKIVFCIVIILVMWTMYRIDKDKDGKG